MINYVNFFFYFFFFCFGAVVGSFLNVVALRMNTGKDIFFSRSACMSCSQKLRWYELVPIFSYLFQGGKCRNCKSIISPQYVVVEIITGVLFAALAHLYVGYEILFYFIIFSILIVITVYDLRHMIIPDALSYLFSLLVLGKLVLDHGFSLIHMPGLLWLLAGPILALPFALIWFLSKGKWMGLGDAKLVLGFGWLLGLTAGLSAVIFGFWIGAVVSILIMVMQGKSQKHGLSLKSEVPFAPFLILGLVIVFFFRLDLFGLLIAGW